MNRFVFLRQKGLTILELIVVLAIAGTLATIAMPKITEQYSKANTKKMASLLYIDLNFARGQAISMNQNIAFIPMGGEWYRGWEIYNVSINPPVLLRAQGRYKNFSKVGEVIGDSPDVIFKRNGQVEKATKFLIADTKCTGNNGRYIEIKKLGQVVRGTNSCGN